VRAHTVTVRIRRLVWHGSPGDAHLSPEGSSAFIRDAIRARLQGEDLHQDGDGVGAASRAIADAVLRQIDRGQEAAPRARAPQHEATGQEPRRHD
jgi:hypothetical protein